MTASVPRSAWTFDDLVDQPDNGDRYEIIEGRLLVSPAPALPHFRALSLLHRMLIIQAPERFTIGQNGGVLSGPARDTYLIPDLVVVRKEALDRMAATLLPAEILLAVEVLSPRSRSIDLIMKRHQYARMGIPQHWIVDSTARALTVLRLDADSEYGDETVVKAGECWRTDDPFPLELDPADFC